MRLRNKEHIVCCADILALINNIIAFIFLQSKIILFYTLSPRWLSEAAVTFINIGFVWKSV